VSVEYLVTGQETSRDTPRLSAEARSVAQVVEQLDEGNRKLALALVRALKKHEDEAM
jgi:hypothetical protein